MNTKNTIHEQQGKYKHRHSMQIRQRRVGFGCVGFTSVRLWLYSAPLRFGVGSVRVCFGSSLALIGFSSARRWFCSGLLRLGSGSFRVCFGSLSALIGFSSARIRFCSGWLRLGLGGVGVRFASASVLIGFASARCRLFLFISLSRRVPGQNRS